MMGPGRPFLKAVLLLLVSLPGLAQTALADDYQDLVLAEKAFAADAVARNTRDAFLAALADDAVMFQPDPTSGKRLWEARKADTSKLEWAPELAEIAVSGDLGYTSGPWRFTPVDADKPAAFGHFFSVWKKQSDGKWKLLVDHGITHAEVPMPASVQRRGILGVGSPPTWAVGMLELRNADLAPAGALDTRMVSADFLRLREGQLPDGKADGVAFNSSAQRVDAGHAVSAAGDLAATWGGGDSGPTWIRIWRRPAAADAPGKGWVLAADMSHPATATGK